MLMPQPIQVLEEASSQAAVRKSNPYERSRERSLNLNNQPRARHLESQTKKFLRPYVPVHANV